MNTRHSPKRRSSSRSPSTSQRRSPPSTIASTIARSRRVRSAPSSASTSPGSRITRQAPHAAHQRHTALPAAAAPPRRQPSRHRVHRHPDITPSDQVAVQARHRSEPPLDRRRRQPRPPIGDPHHVLRPRPRPALRSDERQHVRRGHLRRLLADDLEEHLQIRCAYARTVFGRALDATNTTYRSSSGSPSPDTLTEPGRTHESTVTATGLLGSRTHPNGRPELP